MRECSAFKGKLNLNRSWVLIAFLAAIVACFLALYGRMIYRLPIFGDAATHAFISTQIVERGLFGISGTGYPPLYHSLGALLIWIGGEVGFQTLALISVAALGLSVFYLAQTLFSMNWLSLVSVILVLASPKTVIYSAKLYMEPLLSASMIFAFALFVRFLKKGDRRYLFLSFTACAASAWIKQQALIILLPAMFAVYIGSLLLRKHTNTEKRGGRSWKDAGIAFIVVLILLAFPLAWQARTSGSILPATEYTDWANRALSGAVGYHAATAPQWAVDWQPRLQQIEDEFFDRSTVRANQRWTRPWDVFSKASSFENIHSVMNPRLYTVNPLVDWLWLVLLISGLILFLATYDRQVVAFLIIFLLLNYLSFARNTDQMRYHVFISYILTPIALFGAANLTRHIARARLRPWILIGLVLLLLAGAVGTAVTYSDRQSGFARSQAYTPSQGGIASVAEVSDWIKHNTLEDEAVLVMPPTEFIYYANRPLDSLDWRYYFLTPEERLALFEDMDAHYVVIMKSIIRDDAVWDHKGYIPASFYFWVNETFEQSYASSVGDIIIYDVERLKPVVEL
ncbi:MAG: hypothetical protein ACYC55_03385 [Candidatus Geothermincolia bacterium]